MAGNASMHLDKKIRALRHKFLTSNNLNIQNTYVLTKLKFVLADLRI